MKKEFKLTRAGVDELEAEIKSLKGNRREIAAKIKTAREFGDLSENAEYHAAMDEHQKTEARVFEIEYIFKNIEIIDKPKNITEVEIGNTVTIKNSKGEKTLSIVGSVEANPMENKISVKSPIGAALLGKKVGEEISAGSSTYKVTSIS